MWTIKVVFLFTFIQCIYGGDSEEEPAIYYYGIEESERGLQLCAARQACGALLQRYWREAALLRLCRCPRRRMCRSYGSADSKIEINNRSYLQFCQPINDWPLCAPGETALVVDTPYKKFNPDELEQLHHKDIQLTPPIINFNCKCRQPNYWRLKPSSEPMTRHYRCASLPVCRTGEYCGNVSHDFFALHQSCLCPKNHICVHNGGVTNYQISELLYTGIGWKAYCQRVREGDSYEDY